VKYSFSSQDFKEIHIIADLVSQSKTDVSESDLVSDEDNSDSDSPPVNCSEANLHSNLQVDLSMRNAEPAVTIA
jgi:hypothetical protein